MTDRQTKSRGERTQEKAIKNLKKRQREQVTNAIDECNVQLLREDTERYYVLGQLLINEICPIVIPNGLDDLHEYQQTDITDEEGWDWVAVERFHNNPEKCVKKAINCNAWAQEIIEGAFRSVEEIAESEGFVKGDLTNAEPAFGKQLRLGEHLQSWDMTLSNPQIYTRESGHPKTGFFGETGQGKSACEEACAYDRYASGMKVMDIIDLGNFENCLWDVPQQQEDLRKIREDAGLAPDFLEDDDLPNPKLEILVPLSKGLEREELPYDTEIEQFKITPFTIPANSIPKSVLVKMMEADLSKQQRTTIRTAYEDVARQKEDWTLEDLQNEINQREDLDDSYKLRASKVLEDLDRLAFIQDNADEHALDLDSIMRDQETITAFSQALVDTDYAQLVVVAYLIDQIVQTRDNNHGYPELLLILRELHEVVPQRNRTAFGERAESIQDAIASRTSKLLRRQRHLDIEPFGDSQYPSDIMKGVRDGFNRAVVFDIPDADLETIFENTPSNKSSMRKCSNSMSSKAGQAAIVGLSEPQVQRSNIDFISPVNIYPSPTHHIDDSEGSQEHTGLHARIIHLDYEEWRKPAEVDGVNWSSEVSRSIEATAEPDEYEKSKNPTGWFFQECVDDSPESEDVYVHASELRRAYGNFADENAFPPIHENPQKFGDRLKKHLDVIQKRDESITYPKDGESAYLGITLTEKGKEFLS